MNGKYGLQKINMNSVLEKIKNSAQERPISEDEPTSSKILNAIYLEVQKNYKISGNTALTSKDEMMDMTRGLAMEGFRDFNEDLLHLIPDLFSIARETKDIPTLKTLAMARSSSKWFYLTKPIREKKEALKRRTEDEVPKVSQEFKDEFFKRTINEIKR
jgi:hypothetical protein